MLVTDEDKEVMFEKIPYIYYPVCFQKDQK